MNNNEKILHVLDSFEIIQEELKNIGMFWNKDMILSISKRVITWISFSI